MIMTVFFLDPTQFHILVTSKVGVMGSVLACKPSNQGLGAVGSEDRQRLNI